MSLKFSKAVWAMRKESIEGLHHAASFVLASLADQMNDDGICWPSHKTTAARTGLSEKQVQRHIQLLKKLGLITVILNKRGGRPGQTPRYKATGLTKWVTSGKQTVPMQGRGTVPTEGSQGPHGGAKTVPMEGTLTVIEPSKNQEPPETLSSWADVQIAGDILGFRIGEFDMLESQPQYAYRVRRAWPQRRAKEIH
jgi:hypothetical protein